MTAKVAVYDSFETMTSKEIRQEELPKYYPTLFKEETNKPLQLNTILLFKSLITGEILHLPLSVYLRRSMKQMDSEKITIELKAIIKGLIDNQDDEHFERVKIYILLITILVTRLRFGILQCMYIFDWKQSY